MNFYIADTHFGHANILKLSNRPYKTIKEMDDAIIANWNARVTDADDVYILGDFAFRSQNPIEYLKVLKGKKHLIIGNHDTGLLKNPESKKYFQEIKEIKTVIQQPTVKTVGLRSKSYVVPC